MNFLLFILMYFQCKINQVFFIKPTFQLPFVVVLDVTTPIRSALPGRIGPLVVILTAFCIFLGVLGSHLETTFGLISVLPVSVVFRQVCPFYLHHDVPNGDPSVESVRDWIRTYRVAGRGVLGQSRNLDSENALLPSFVGTARYSLVVGLAGGPGRRRVLQSPNGVDRDLPYHPVWFWVVHLLFAPTKVWLISRGLRLPIQEGPVASLVTVSRVGE